MYYLDIVFVNIKDLNLADELQRKLKVDLF